jgi:hypothetical protein
LFIPPSSRRHSASTKILQKINSKKTNMMYSFYA